jgi:Leucine-rich repeat (LRR) protein
MGIRRSLQLNTLVLKTLLLLFYGASGTNCFVVHGNTTDRCSLLDFKEAITSDPTGALRDWNDSIHHCMWSGVSCSTRHPDRVTALQLIGLNLAGQITPSLGNLTFLRYLRLSSNRFSGQLPPLNRLIKLKYLVLSENLLHENIQGALIALTNCSELTWLDLSSNSLTGNIPPTFSNITRLVLIDLSDNLLGGSIPEELCQLSDKGVVILSSNRLSGRVPAAFFNHSSLEVLELSMNALSGTLPSDIGDTLPNLFWLSLGTNNLEGHIPASLGNASMLKHLDLSSNYFTGQIR